MDIKEYIKSGVLEAYLGGELSNDEMVEVDQLALQYPMVKQELEEIRTSIHNYALSSGRQPSTDLLDNVLGTIAGSTQKSESESTEVRATEPTNEIPMTPVRSVPYWAVAASVLLLVSAGFNLFFYGKLKESQEEVIALTQERSLLTNKVETASEQLDYAELRIAHFLNDDNIHVRMDGEQISPESFANVFWNKNTNAVFISVDNLPSPPDGHQYQLWAIKSGQAPIDAGIFDHSKLVQELKVIKGDVLAFAVTLEREGGTQNASVDKTFVKGFVKNT